ncbi:MAG: M23 family metallopeptidase [Pseudomonadota bacterium]
MRRVLLLIVATAVSCAFLTTPASAKKLYSYQDKYGRWQYSDTPPNTDAEVTVQRIKVRENKKKINIRQVGTRENPVFQVQNLLGGPIEIQFELTEADNILAEPSLPRSFVIEGGETKRLFSLGPENPDQRWRYAYKYNVVLGSPEAQHDEREQYFLPYPTGRKFAISQGFNGQFSHFGPQSRYAVDFAMPDGTPVHAARGGVVMDIARDFYSGGTNAEKFGSRANYVRILHDDGTIALYAHLRWESVLVVIGDRVRKGEVIAKSGNTGFSTGPHLHFAVQLNEGMRLVSVPFKFKSADKADLVTPRVGDFLIAQ